LTVMSCRIVSSSSTTMTRDDMPGGYRRSAPFLATSLLTSSSTPAPVAQGIEHRPPEAVAQVRILPGALSVSAGQRTCPCFFRKALR
jgi:hypothetical protein